MARTFTIKHIFSSKARGLTCDYLAVCQNNGAVALCWYSDHTKASRFEDEGLCNLLAKHAMDTIGYGQVVITSLEA